MVMLNHVPSVCQVEQTDMRAIVITMPLIYMDWVEIALNKRSLFHQVLSSGDLKVWYCINFLLLHFLLDTLEMKKRISPPTC